MYLGGMDDEKLDDVIPRSFTKKTPLNEKTFLILCLTNLVILWYPREKLYDILETFFLIQI